MNLKEIRDLINLMNDHGLSEVEIEREGSKVKIKKGGQSVDFTTDQVQYQPIVSPRQIAATVGPSSEESASKNDHHKEVKSPMVGTFYRSPSPESPPFVENGQMVEVGQVVCIVEAMKLMNEIKSEVRGKVVEVRVDNAQPVEFGQTLFVVEAG